VKDWYICYKHSWIVLRVKTSNCSSGEGFGDLDTCYAKLVVWQVQGGQNSFHELNIL
jgi:hypothetical protein